MKILCASGIVRRRRVGKWTYYAIDKEGCDHAIHLMESVANGSMKGVSLFIRTMRRIIRMFKQFFVKNSIRTKNSCCNAEM